MVLSFILYNKALPDLLDCIQTNKNQLESLKSSINAKKQNYPAFKRI